MKTSLFMLVVSAFLITTVSCKSKSQRTAEKYMSDVEKAVKENSPPEEDEKQSSSGSPNIPPGMENIIGEWELVSIVSDVNGNHKIDAHEVKTTPAYKDMLVLNKDGTAAYTIARFKAWYEIVTKEDGRKKLVMFDSSKTEINRGRYIISVTGDELVLNKIISGSSFEVYKRL